MALCTKPPSPLVGEGVRCTLSGDILPAMSPSLKPRSEVGGSSLKFCKLRWVSGSEMLVGSESVAEGFCSGRLVSLWSGREMDSDLPREGGEEDFSGSVLLCLKPGNSIRVLNNEGVTACSSLFLR